MDKESREEARMRIVIELSFNGRNHLSFYGKYSYELGRNVNVFSFRVRPLFFVVEIRRFK